LTGTPPSANLLTQLAAMDALSAAKYSIDPANAESKGFYNVTLKNFATPWTNRDQTVFAPLNDYTATVIAWCVMMCLSIHCYRPMCCTSAPQRVCRRIPIPTTTQLSRSRGPRHRPAIEQQLGQANAIVGYRPAGQAVAGVITSRAAAEAFFIDGTNRAMFRFTMLNHLCHDMETVQETTRPPDRIRQDVSRQPRWR